MLHDPRHDKTPSLAGFALFVASKEPKEAYNWNNCQECAVGQYLKSMEKLPTTENWSLDPIHGMNMLAKGKMSPIDPAYGSDWTFGKLADRILAHQMETVG